MPIFSFMNIGSNPYCQGHIFSNAYDCHGNFRGGGFCSGGFINSCFPIHSWGCNMISSAGAGLGFALGTKIMDWLF